MVIESIAEIGKIYRDSTAAEVWDLVIEYPDVNKILAIYIDTNTNTAKICDEGDATREKIAKTLFTKPPSKGPGAAPTAELNTKDPKKTLNDKIIPWFKNHGREDLALIISENIKAEDISELLGPKESAIITVKIDGEWPSEIPWMVDVFRQTLTEKMGFGVYGGKPVRSESEGICSICGKENTVYGFVLSWVGMNFATADKPGFFEDLDVSRAWKIIPICADCAWNIRIGWKILLEREREYKVSGLQYLVFPSKCVSSGEIEEFLENIEKPQSKFAVFSGIAEAEETIEDIDTNIDLLVYRKDQNKMEVYLLEQNIPPGTFRKIRERNSEVAKAIMGIRNTKVLPILSAYSEILDAVFRDEKSKTKKLKELAQMIHAIVRNQNWPGKKYAYFVEYIEMQTHNKQNGLDYAYRGPLLVYIYFMGGDEVAENLVENIRFPSRTAEFAFWTGVLARHVVEMQNKAGSQHGTEPFRKRIRNVRMNVHQLQRLYTDAFEKAKMYSEMLGDPWVMWTNNIVELCAEKATNFDAATPDEIGFFFAVGYGLYWKVVKQEKDTNIERGGKNGDE